MHNLLVIVAIQVGTMRKYQSTNKFYLQFEVVPYKIKNSDENSKPDITSEFQIQLRELIE